MRVSRSGLALRHILLRSGGLRTTRTIFSDSIPSSTNDVDAMGGRSPGWVESKTFEEHGGPGARPRCCRFRAVLFHRRARANQDWLDGVCDRSDIGDRYSAKEHRRYPAEEN